MRVLGLDIGSSSVKAAVLTGPTPRHIIRQPFKTTYTGDRVEVSPVSILTAVKKAIAELGDAARHVDLIVPTGMSPSWLAIDANGRALTPIVTHQDRRSQAEAEAIEHRIGRAAHLKIVGNRPTPGGISSTTAAWFVKHEKSIMRKAALVGHLNTWLIHAATGERAMDPSNASFTGLFRTTTLDGWYHDLIAAAGVERAWLPDVIDGNVIAGRVTTAGARRLGLTAGTPMLAGVVDGSGGLLMAGAGGDAPKQGGTMGRRKATPAGAAGRPGRQFVMPGTILNVIGSTDVLAVVTTTAKPAEGLLTRALGVGGLWLSVGTVAAAGTALDWLHRTLFADLPAAAFYAETARQMKRPRSTTLTFDARLAGSRTSVEPVRATLAGLSLGSDRRDVLAALLDSLARQSGERFAAFRRAGVRPGKLVHTTGGGAASLAGVLRRDWPGGLRFKSLKEATLGGAWVLAQSTIER